jgi:hypothetical protein
VTNFDNNTSYTWTVADGSVTNAGDLVNVMVDTSSFINDLAGGQFVVGSGSLNLRFTNNHAPQAFATNYTRAKHTLLRIPLPDLITSRTSDPDGQGRVLDHLVSAAGLNKSANGYNVATDANFIYYTNTVDNAIDTIDYVVLDTAPYRAGDTKRYATNTITITVTDSVGSLTITNAGPGVVSFNFYGIPGYDYVVQRSCDNLESWVDVVTNMAPTSGNIGLIQFTETFGQSGCTSGAYYRMRSE